MNKSGPVGVGIIGAGNISDTYLENLTSFPDVNVLFVADLDLARAKEQASKYGVPGSGKVEELLANGEIEIVVNLTIPATHVEIGLKAIESGKHVWCEKPYAIDRKSGEQLNNAAKEAGLKISVAPDTFLGAGIQTALRAIADGLIGKPVSALALFQVEGPESWHPNPAFYFQPGGGPLLDMGPYYLTAIVQIFGSAKKVTATATMSKEERIFGAGPNKGDKFPVNVATQISSLIEFENGGSAVVIFSFDSTINRAGFLEITGTEGVAVLPDPNNFDGPTTLHLGSGQTKLLQAEGARYGRGVGALDLAQSIRTGRTEQAPGQLAFHVLDIMLSIIQSAQLGQTQWINSEFKPTTKLPIDWDPTIRTL